MLQTRARALKAEGRSVNEAADAIAKERQAQYANRQPARIAPAARVAYREAP
jgi:hypothetical protein